MVGRWLQPQKSMDGIPSFFSRSLLDFEERPDVRDKVRRSKRGREIRENFFYFSFLSHSGGKGVSKALIYGLPLNHSPPTPSSDLSNSHCPRPNKGKERVVARLISLSVRNRCLLFPVGLLRGAVLVRARPAGLGPARGPPPLPARGGLVARPPPALERRRGRVPHPAQGVEVVKELLLVPIIR